MKSTRMVKRLREDLSDRDTTIKKLTAAYLGEEIDKGLAKSSREASTRWQSDRKALDESRRQIIELIREHAKYKQRVQDTWRSKMQKLLPCQLRTPNTTTGRMDTRCFHRATRQGVIAEKQFFEGRGKIPEIGVVIGERRRDFQWPRERSRGEIERPKDKPLPAGGEH